MSRKHWLDRLTGSSRPPAGIVRRPPAQLAIRQLERRRVLDAAAPAILISPTPTTEGDAVTVSTAATGIDSPQFDWTVTVDAVVIATSNDALFEFTPPDNGTYVVDLLITDAGAIDYTNSRTINVRNAAPVLSVNADAFVDEGAILSLVDLGTITDAGFDDPATGSEESFTYLINWGDGHVDAGNATVDQVGGPGARRSLRSMERTFTPTTGFTTYASPSWTTMAVAIPRRFESPWETCHRR